MGRSKARHNVSRLRRNKPVRSDRCRSKGGTEKIRYTTKDEADAEARYQGKLFNRAMRTYECPTCAGWHTATKKMP